MTNISPTEALTSPISSMEISPAETLSQDTSTREILKIMCTKDIGSFLLKDGSGMSGIVTERDMLLKLSKENIDSPVSEIMTPSPKTLSDDDTLEDCIKLIAAKQFRHIPILNDSTTKMMSIKDILKFLSDLFPKEISELGTKFEWKVLEEQSRDYSFDLIENEEHCGLNGKIFLGPLRKIPPDHLLPLDVNTSIWEALDQMRDKRVGSICLMEYETNLVGVLTERDFLLKVFAQLDFDQDRPCSDFMTKNPHHLHQKHLISYAINNMLHCGYRTILIVNDDIYPDAIITPINIIKYVSDHL